MSDECGTFIIGILLGMIIQTFIITWIWSAEAENDNIDWQCTREKAITQTLPIENECIQWSKNK